VVGEVACGVEELLRHDRRPQPDLRQRETLPRLAGLTAALEPFPRRGAVELDDDRVVTFTLQATHPTGVEGDELHGGLTRSRSTKVTFVHLRARAAAVSSRGGGSLGGWDAEHAELEREGC